MKIDNLLDVITYSIISYYSLIRKFETTSILISGIRYCIRQMWNKYMSDIEAEEAKFEETERNSARKAAQSHGNRF